MNNYTETEKKLNQIRYKDEIMFRMAISHLLDTGIRHLTPENVESTCAKIMEQDDTHSFMTNEYQCELVRIAAKLAEVDHIHLLVYISRHIYYDVMDGAAPYETLEEVVKNYIASDALDFTDNGATIDRAIEHGLNTDNIDYMGLGYMIDSEEEEEYEA